MCVIIKEYVSCFDTPETQKETGVGKKHNTDDRSISL